MIQPMVCGRVRKPGEGRGSHLTKRNSGLPKNTPKRNKRKSEKRNSLDIALLERRPHLGWGLVRRTCSHEPDETFVADCTRHAATSLDVARGAGGWMSTCHIAACHSLPLRQKLPLGHSLKCSKVVGLCSLVRFKLCSPLAFWVASLILTSPSPRLTLALSS